MNILPHKVFFIFFLTVIACSAFTQTITVDSDITIFNQASENYTSKIELITNSEDANVFIDGEFKGKTPLNIENVSQGFHLIQIEKDQFITKQFQIIVKPYSNQRIIIELKKTKKYTKDQPPSQNIENNKKSEDNLLKEKKLSVTTAGTYNGCIKNFITPQNTLNQMQISVLTTYKINSMFKINATLSPQYYFIADDMSDGANFSFNVGLNFFKEILNNFSISFNTNYKAETSDYSYSLFLYSPDEIPGLCFSSDLSWKQKHQKDSDESIFLFSISPGIIYGGTSGFFNDSFFISQAKFSASWENEFLFLDISTNCNQNLQNFSQWRFKTDITSEFKFSKQDFSLGIKNGYAITGSSRGREFLGFSLSCFCTIKN